MRPEGFEEAVVMFVGLDRNRIIQGIDILQGKNVVIMIVTFIWLQIIRQTMFQLNS